MNTYTIKVVDTNLTKIQFAEALLVVALAPLLLLVSFVHPLDQPSADCTDFADATIQGDSSSPSAGLFGF